MSNTKSAARPDDKPFDFNLDAARTEADLSPFVIQWAGRRWTLAHMQTLDVWPLADAAEQGDLAATRAAFSAALGEDWPEFQKHPLPQYKMAALFNAYQKHCGITAGESPASDGS